jgi:hypothetical protein
MGASQRRKGATFERDLSKLLSAAWGVQAKRGIGQARSASEVSDVEGTAFWVEAKHHRKPNVHDAYTQAAAATDGRPILVVTKETNGDVLATMRLDDFCALTAPLFAQPKDPAPG